MTRYRERLVAFWLEHPVMGMALILFALAWPSRLWSLLSIGWSWEDAYFYIGLAKSLAQGKFELVGHFHAKYLPGYPLGVVLIRALTLGGVDWYRCAQLVSALSSSLLPPLCAVLVHDLGRDRHAAWAAGLIAVFNAHLVVFGGVAWSECFFGMLSLLSLVLLPRAPLAGGLIAGWAAVTRHEGLLLVAAYAVAAAWREGRWRRVAGAAVALAVGAAWWLIVHAQTGTWLHQTYAGEISERLDSLGRVGPGWILLSFPVAGHLATLFALLGPPGLIRKPHGAAALVFLAFYWAVHAWWMFRDERYFIPMVPLVCCLAGVGLSNGLKGLGAWIGRRMEAGSRDPAVIQLLPGRMVVALGLAAGLTHFIGFAPFMIREEAERSTGYAQAAKWLRERAGPDSILAYDALMVGYSTGRAVDRPCLPGEPIQDPPLPRVCPSGPYPDNAWQDHAARLYFENGVRWVLWSDLYPSDREKSGLASYEPTWLHNEVEVNGKSQTVTFDLQPAAAFAWTAPVAATGWSRPYRKLKVQTFNAYIFFLKLDQPIAP